MFKTKCVRTAKNIYYVLSKLKTVMYRYSIRGGRFG